MRKTTFIVMLGIAVAMMAGVTPLKWKETSIDLGQVKKGEVKEITFEFTNKSNEAIQILEAIGSCGCTKIQFPKEVIEPNESAAIKANFNSTKVGVFSKSIRIKTSDSEEYTNLYFSGEVVE